MPCISSHAGPWLLAMNIYLVFGSALANTPSTQSLLDLSLDDLSKIRVITASRSASDIAKAPAVISVITAKDIERFGANSLVEVVERFPGITTLSGYVFQNNAMSVRGDLPNQNDAHLLILINGRPFRSGFSGGFNGAILDNYPLRAIERLEFVRGPGSVLYGSNAYSGVLNIITKRAARTAAQVALGGGSFSTRQAAVSAGFKNEGFDAQIDATLFDEDGWRGALTDEMSVTDSVRFSEENLAFSATGRIGDFFIDAFTADTEQTHLGSVPRWPADTIERDAYYLGVGHETQLNPAWVLTSSFSYTGSRQDYPFNPGGTIQFDGEADEFHLESFAVGQLGGNWQVLLGGNVTYLQGEIDGDGAVTLAPYDLTWASVFSQVDYQINERVDLFFGGQYNKAEDVDATFVPRLGAIWRYRDDMGIKLLYSEAFRSPYPAETSVVSDVVVGHPGLDPETVRTVDLQWYLQRQDVQFAVTAFDTHQDDLIRRSPGSPGTFVNAGEINIQGLEFEGRWHVSPQWLLSGSWTAQRNEDGSGVDDVTLAPDVLAKLGIAWMPRSGLSLGLFDHYTDAYQDVAIISPGRSLANPAADSHHLLSINLRLHLPTLWPGQGLPDAVVSFYGSNLLDEDVYVPEYTRGLINTLPARAGRAGYLNVEVTI